MTFSGGINSSLPRLPDEGEEREREREREREKGRRREGEKEEETKFHRLKREEYFTNVVTAVSAFFRIFCNHQTREREREREGEGEREGERDRERRFSMQINSHSFPPSTLSFSLTFS